MLRVLRRMVGAGVRGARPEQEHPAGTAEAVSDTVTDDLDDDAPFTGTLPWGASPAVGAVAAGFMALVCVVCMAVVPSGYVITAPGVVLDTLGKADGQELITISGRTTYPTDGTLDLTTVTVYGGPNGPAGLLHLLQAWIGDDQVVQPTEELYGSDETEEEASEAATQEMTDSQSSATAAALGELGVEVPLELTLAGVADGVPAADVLEADDVLLDVNGTAATTLSGYKSLLDGVTPGDTVPVTVRRDGEKTTVQVTTVEGTEGQALLGVYLTVEIDPPFEVEINIDSIGGPSAGQMFALGIYDKLTPGSLTGGQSVAGTGTIDLDGEVGAIGGIRQKLIAARRAGATWFLAPESNCTEVVGHVPDGLTVVPVQSLAESIETLKAIADGDTSALPACTG